MSASTEERTPTSPSDPEAPAVSAASACPAERPADDASTPPPHRSAVVGWTLLALLAADVEPILVKIGYQSNATPLQLLTVKTMMSGLLIYPITRRWRWMGWRRCAEMARVSVLLLMTNLLMLAGLAHAGVVTALTIVTTTPALVALVNRARGREVHDLRFWCGFVLCFGGVLVTLDPGRQGGLSCSALGLALLGGAVISSTLYRTALEDLTRRHEPLLISTWFFIINGTLVTVLLLPFIGPVPPTAIGIGMWIGLTGALANVAFVAAVSMLGATRMSIINMLQRPLIIVTAAVILNEPFSALQAVGVALVVWGVQLARVKRTDHARNDDCAPLLRPVRRDAIIPRL